MLYFEIFKNDYKLLNMVKISHCKFYDQWSNFFFSRKIQMIIYCRDGRSDTRSGSYRVFKIFGYFSIKV